MQTDKDLDYLTDNIRIRAEQVTKEVKSAAFGLCMMLVLLVFMVCMNNYKITKTMRMVEEIRQGIVIKGTQ